MSDLINRQTAIDALNGIINMFEQILRDIRESKVDDSVCGMCEYDGAYIGQSGDWCNECPGFDKDDCFKLSDECRKRWLKSVDLPSAQPEQRWVPIKWHECTDEDREKYGFNEDICYVFDCNMPDDNQKILVTTSRGHVEKDVCYIDDGFSLDSGWDWIEDIVAWKPLPEPWKGEKK